jgi:hypothetical protein
LPSFSRLSAISRRVAWPEPPDRQSSERLSAAKHTTKREAGGQLRPGPKVGDAHRFRFGCAPLTRSTSMYVRH